MSQNMVIAMAVVLISIFVTTQEVLKYRLKKEQIKADAMVRTEEIKAKNQLEIEKLIQKDNFSKSESGYEINDTNNDEFQSERRSRISDKI